MTRRTDPNTVLARRREQRARIELDEEAADRIRRAREALGLPTEDT